MRLFAVRQTAATLLLMASFEDHVRAALDSLPPQLAAALENVAVVVEDENPEDPDLFGLYDGTPLPERVVADVGRLPDRISIYRLPLEDEFGHDPELLEHEIRITVLHELAHYFGIEEDRIAELGLRVITALEVLAVVAARRRRGRDPALLLRALGGMTDRRDSFEGHANNRGNPCGDRARQRAPRRPLPGPLEGP